MLRKLLPLTVLAMIPIALIGLGLRGKDPTPFPGPELTLWAWERPEDLGFLAEPAPPAGAGVAFLAVTLTLRGAELIEEPRRNPLRVPRGLPLTAVARIEADPGSPLAGSEEPRRRSVEILSSLAAIPGVTAIQVDFDATVSQRAFYRALLEELRVELPGETGLAITALASWCFLDGWIEGLPVDEAVPMLFRMGLDEREIRLRLARGEDFRQPLCRRSVGISTDEAPPELPRGRRIWAFHPRSWTPDAYDALRREIAR